MKSGDKHFRTKIISDKNHRIKKRKLSTGLSVNKKTIRNDLEAFEP